MSIYIRIILLLVSLAAPAAEADTTIGVPADDPDMVAAINRARMEVGSVIRAIESGNKDVSVKVPIADNGTVEHFWLSDVQYDAKAETFQGTIDNDPNTVKTVKLGQRTSVHQSQISDWLYMSKGRMHGNYTLRVLLPLMKPEEAAQFRDVLSDD